MKQTVGNIRGGGEAYFNEATPLSVFLIHSDNNISNVCNSLSPNLPMKVNSLSQNTKKAGPSLDPRGAPPFISCLYLYYIQQLTTVQAKCTY